MALNSGLCLYSKDGTSIALSVGILDSMQNRVEINVRGFAVSISPDQADLVADALRAYATEIRKAETNGPCY